MFYCICKSCESICCAKIRQLIVAFLHESFHSPYKHASFLVISTSVSVFMYIRLHSTFIKNTLIPQLVLFFLNRPNSHFYDKKSYMLHKMAHMV